MELLSLNKIFENRLFRIPDYQRGYAWRSDADKEVVAFWNDLMNLPEGKSHFTGSLTLQKKTDEEKLGKDKWLTSFLDFSPWYVVDGRAEAYRQLGRNANHLSKGKVAVLDDDDFLRTHWILYYQYSRKTGNDYVNYLLGKKFTVQNVLQNLAQTESTQELVQDNEAEYADDAVEQETKTALNEVSLKPDEISSYVKDLQNTPKVWYYTWFPQDAQDEELSEEETEWMERINRLGISYFRPLITASFYERLVNRNISHNDSLSLLKAIERFIFIEFRLQMMTRSNYGSSEFNIAACDLHNGKKTVNDIKQMLEERIDRSFEIDEATGQKVFKTRNMQVMVNKLFEQKDDERAGYYRWSAIHYFLYEYNTNLMKEGYHGNSVTLPLNWRSYYVSA